MNKFYNEIVIDRLQILGISQHSDWFDEQVLKAEDIPNYKFWNTLPTKNIGVIDVPLKNVIGTNHTDYSNNLWIENLGKLKRFSSCFTEQYSNNYFNTLNQSTSISMSKYGDDFIIGEGNHRTHCAKFLGIQHIKANVVERFFDSELYNLVINCEHLGFSISDQIFREGVWQIEINNVIFCINKFEILNHFVSLFKTTKITWFETKKIKLKNKFFLKGKSDKIYFYHLRKITDFDKKIINIIKALKVLSVK